MDTLETWVRSGPTVLSPLTDAVNPQSRRDYYVVKRTMST